MERSIYAAIKLTFTTQIAAEKRALLDRIPMLCSLSQVRCVTDYEVDLHLPFQQAKPLVKFVCSTDEPLAKCAFK